LRWEWEVRSPELHRATLVETILTLPTSGRTIFVGLFAAGCNETEILQAYPYLEAGHLNAALAYSMAI
jgi:hypothetical protein